MGSIFVASVHTISCEKSTNIISILGLNLKIAKYFEILYRRLFRIFSCFSELLFVRENFHIDHLFVITIRNHFHLNSKPRKINPESKDMIINL